MFGEDHIQRRALFADEAGQRFGFLRAVRMGDAHQMLMCIVRTKEVPKVLEIVRSHDRSAFTVISEVTEVRGLGFKEE